MIQIFTLLLLPACHRICAGLAHKVFPWLSMKLHAHWNLAWQRAGWDMETLSDLWARQFALALGLLLGLFLAVGTGWGTLYVTLCLLGILSFEFMMAHRKRMREDALLRALPFKLDLLALGLEAGMDLIMAMELILSRSSEPQGVLETEWQKVLAMVRMGKTRSDAFAALAKRMELESLYQLASLIHQNEALGTDLGGALRLIADESQAQAYARAEEQAQKLPVKMLVPLLICIFPVTFVLVILPMGLSFFGMGVL